MKKKKIGIGEALDDAGVVESDTGKDLELGVNGDEAMSEKEKDELHGWANPAPLGFTGLAVGAISLSLHDFGLSPGGDTSLLLPWVLICGGGGQFLAGLIDYRRGNLFGGTAFLGYSLLWFSMALEMVLELWDKPSQLDVQTNENHAGFGLVGFLLFSLMLTTTSVLLNTFFFLMLLTIDLALTFSLLHTFLEFPKEIPGAFLLIVAFFAFYGASAALLNGVSKKKILPFGKALWSPSR